MVGKDPGAIGVFTDASAAIGIVQRTGVGKVRHIDVGMLWVQQNQKTGEIEVEKVGTKQNPADIFTKHVPGEVVWRHLTAMGFEDRQGRAEAAVKLVRVEAGGDDIGEGVREGSQVRKEAP